MGYATFHWRAVSVLMRVVGIWWLLGGIGFITAAIRELVSPSGVAGNFLVSPVVDAAVVGAFVILAAVVLLRVRPYRPDLARVAGRTSWWTGEPMTKDEGAV